MGWSTVGLGLFLSTVVWSSVFLAVVLWCGLSIAGFGLLVSTLGARDAVGFLLMKALGSVGLVRGLFVTPKPPEAFPMDQVERIQAGPVHGQFTRIS